MIKSRMSFLLLGTLAFFCLTGFMKQEEKEDKSLSDAEIENLVKRSYQYVALYNIINKFAVDDENREPVGWNHCVAYTELRDHNQNLIARPNNDNLLTNCMLDLRREPMILTVPVIDSKYASLLLSAYDHYVQVPMTTRTGDFAKEERILLYTKRTRYYDGEVIEGIDRFIELDGDFATGLFRAMPHAADPERFQAIVEQMKSIKLVSLSEYFGNRSRRSRPVHFPEYSKTDVETFSTNLLDVMQFVFDHNTFDTSNEMDQQLLVSYKPLGVWPKERHSRRQYRRNRSKDNGLYDKERFGEIAEKVRRENLALLGDRAAVARLAPKILRPKGQTDLEAVLAASVVGPIGLPLEEASYLSIGTVDGTPMNAMNDYVLRIPAENLPPAKAFWSFTLYDLNQGFFIPNDRNKYSVGENSGMKLNEEGGIDIYIAVEKPEGVPLENWLPITREDLNLNLMLRMYVPDLAMLQGWVPPKIDAWISN